MTKPISSFPDSERMNIARKRASRSEDGLGKISAVNYLKRAGVAVSKETKKESLISINSDAESS